MLGSRPALIVVDVQEGFSDEDYWGERNNPDCESNIEALIGHWHQRRWPVVVVQHDSTDPDSPLHPGRRGHDLLPCVTGGNLLVNKSVNSSFHGTPDLHAWLIDQNVTDVVICGITTNHCCETTARVSGNLGHRTLFVIDATHTFARRGPDGDLVSADDLARVTATNLHAEFATVVRTGELVAE